MMDLKRQRGASFVFWVFFLALMGFILMVGIKLFPVYYRGFAAEKVIEDLAFEMEGKSPNKKQLWDSIDKRLYINNISNVKKEHLVYNKVKKSLEFGVKYEVRVPLIANIDVIVKFDHLQTINTKK